MPRDFKVAERLELDLFAEAADLLINTNFLPCAPENNFSSIGADDRP